MGIVGHYARQVSTTMNLRPELSAKINDSRDLEHLGNLCFFCVFRHHYSGFPWQQRLWKPPEVVSLQHPQSCKHSKYQERADSNTSFPGQGFWVLQLSKYPNTEVLNQADAQSSPQLNFSLRLYQQAAGHVKSDRAALCTDQGEADTTAL